MKKVFAICMALVMVFALTVTVCAAPGSFVISPSGNRAPVIVEYTNESDDCEATLTVIPFNERDTLTEEEKKEMESAYDAISGASNLTDMFSGLNSVIDGQGILSTDLAVSDLFHINFNDCEEHNEHGAFKIKLSADTLKGFVGLIQIIDGEWVLVADAAVEGDSYLTFTADQLGTFAIVVDSTRAEATSPVTGDPTGYYVVGICALAVLSLAAAGFVFNKKKA